MTLYFRFIVGKKYMYVGNHRPNKPNGSAFYTTEVRCNLLGSGTEYGYRKSLIAQNPGKNDS